MKSLLVFVLLALILIFQVSTRHLTEDDSPTIQDDDSSSEWTTEYSQEDSSTDSEVEIESETESITEESETEWSSEEE